MDSKVQEVCQAVQKMGGSVCTERLPELNVGEFSEPKPLRRKSASRQWMSLIP